MYLRTLLLLLVLGAIAAFAAVNWGAFTTPATLSLLFTTVQAPLGLIMLGLAAMLAVLFLVFFVYLQTSVIIEARRYARELRANGNLPNKPKPRASRIYAVFCRLNCRSLLIRRRS